VISLIIRNYHKPLFSVFKGIILICLIFPICLSCVFGFSCALLEAQALGIPVVTFDTGGNRELVANGLTGWINPYLDIEALIAKSLDLIVNQDARARMGAAARTHAMELADPSRILAAFEGIFSELVRN
jgi:glycosyltransferase involved in cell wall biosynthesis